MLNPYLKVPNLNGGMLSTCKQSNIIASALGRDYDKRASKDGLMNAATDLVDTYTDLVDTVSNALGLRSPMYTIGEIRTDEEDPTSQYWNDNTRGLVRAITTTSSLIRNRAGLRTQNQTGVIIDGLGDITGVTEVDFSQNPLVFKEDNIVDNRVRKPATVRMTVFVSNYMTDDIVDTTLKSLSDLDTTGTVDVLLNDGNTRAQSKLYQLRSLQETARPFTVYTPHGIYENMLIKRLTTKTDAEKMDMLWCEIDFQEVIMYTEYTTQPGTVPARRGIESVSAGWTETAKNKWNAMTGNLIGGII